MASLDLRASVHVSIVRIDKIIVVSNYDQNGIEYGVIR